MRRLSILLSALGIFFLQACKDEPRKEETVKDGYALFQSDSLGLSIEYPQTYELKENIKPEIPVSFIDKTSPSENYLDWSKIMLNIEPLPAVQLQLLEYLQASQTELKILMPSLRMYDTDSLESIQGKKVGTYQYDRDGKERSFTCKMYVFLLEGRAVNVNCVSLKDEFENKETEFDELVKSIKFK